MSVLADFHIHSYFSDDSDAPTKDMVRRGVELGFTHICFTERLDYEFGISPRKPIFHKLG